MSFIGYNQPIAHCRSCEAPLAVNDRFCNRCGAPVVVGDGLSAERRRKRIRAGGALMFGLGLAFLFFAAIHRNPADLILVVAFGLPLMGAGAVVWRSA
jgi:predicted nucleic acid-binding Zn ribbon protein